MWVLAFAVVQCIYRYLMTVDQQKFFEYAAVHLNVRLIHIPLTFMLGFFVTIVVDRWRSVFTNIGFIENVALSVGTLVAGTDNAAKVLRRTIIRYLVLSQVLVLRDISMRVRRRFPTMESLVSGGFLYKDELEKMYRCETMYNKYWLPTHWANQLVHKAMFETKNVDSVQSMNSVLMNIKEFRQSMEMLTKYDWVPIPIAYPQVAEALLNPLGEDDDDFECNWLIDRNMSTGIEIVDTCHDSCPPLKLEEPDDEKGTMYWCQ
uniref:Bestrophin homolog n=1 Tax=Caenorhabditis tropicalis TaxID=1561998 RepID=A0A1I7UIL9_9PELO